jgi:hypothetical protein
MMVGLGRTDGKEEERKEGLNWKIKERKKGIEEKRKSIV